MKLKNRKTLGVAIMMNIVAILFTVVIGATLYNGKFIAWLFIGLSVLLFVLCLLNLYVMTCDVITKWDKE